MRQIITSIAKSGVRAAIVAAVATASTGAAFAATTISSNATDVKVSLTLLGLPTTLTAGTASGTAPASYNINNNFAAIGQSLTLGNILTLGQGVSTGVMNASAASNGTTGSASATINNLGLNLASLGIQSLGVSSSLITSNTAYDGSVFTGSSSVADLALTKFLGTVAFDTSLYAASGINRKIVDTLGLTITLNEQIGLNGIANNISTQSLTTNALHIAYNNYAIGGQFLTGDVIIGQSQVSVQQAVPEPATWAMMIVGFGMVGGTLRRRHGVARAVAA